MDLDAALQTYLTESRELLIDMEEQLLAFEGDNVSDFNESINAIFRAAHTIKGSAGLFELDAIVAFTHKVENVLDKVRAGTVDLNKPLIALLLECKDQIETLLDEVEDPATKSEATRETSDALIVQLQEYLGETPAQGAVEPAQASTTKSVATVEREMNSGVDQDDWYIYIQFPPDAYRDGMDPLSFVSYLATLGTIKHVHPLTGQFPKEGEFDPETCYLGLEIGVNSTATKQELEDVFEFIKDDCKLAIVAPHSHIDEYIDLIKSLPNHDLMLGEMLVQCGALTANELSAALHQQKQTQHEQHDEIAPPIGEVIAQQHENLKPVVKTAVDKQKQIREHINKEAKSLRVDADKLDTLINLIGELVTAGAGTALQASETQNAELIESIGTLNGLLEEVRDAALRLRMVPIGATFSRFQRVVRDVAKDLGKDVDLVITGADTELDKSVVEKVGDPLLHLVRNAIDHGLEQSEERVKQGKSARGQLALNAYHDSGSIVIEVSDDGKGLDPDVLRQKGIEKGLIAEDAQLSEADLFKLIFEAGFSTAQSVSNLSGRGVGMDVVRRNVTELRGRIDIESKLGQGTTVRIMLPLTLAIIDGFSISVGDNTFVVPLDAVMECVELDQADTHSDGRYNYINLRSQVLPIVNIRQHFALGGQLPKRQNIVVVQSGTERIGLVVDKLLGEFQTVIKPLGELFTNIDSISGSTIMGNGEVGLILDIQGLINSVTKHKHNNQSHMPVQ